MILTGDCLEILPTLDAESVQTVVTSPPYWNLRDYGVDGQIGLEATLEEYIAKIVTVFSMVHRVLRDDGTLWLNLGDSYAGNRSYQVPDNKHRDVGNSRGMTASRRRDNEPIPRSDFAVAGLKPKDMMGVPWLVAFALQRDGWYLRSACPWIKRNCMPESCKDRPTNAIEYVFLFSKSEHYFYDHEAVKITASPDTHARYARGRSDTHKWADGGPGGQTIARSLEHMAGVNPKAALGVIGREKQNPSFSAATKDVVGSRARRNSDWFFESFQGLLSDDDQDPLAFIVNSKGFSGAHFATFPEKLVEPCIKAGTSEKGCCPECGSPWERVMGGGKRSVPYGSLVDHSQDMTVGRNRNKLGGQKEWDQFEPQQTTGWRPTCSCFGRWYTRRWVDEKGKEHGAPYWRSGKHPKLEPCTVLDCFGGANTTGNVAERLGRKSIIIELNPAYSEMGERREDAARLPLLEAL